MNRFVVMALVAVIIGLVVGLLVVESGSDDPPITLQEPNTVVRTVTTPSLPTSEPTTQPSTTPDDGAPPPDGDGGSGGVEAP